MNAKAFAEAMLVLGETFNEPVSDVRIEAYADALADLEPNAVLAAMKACVREGDFFPRPKEIRNRVVGRDEDRAELAWAEVIKAVQTHGYANWPAHLEGPTMDAVRAAWGSWSRLCETLPGEGPELLGWRKVFIANYGAVERQTPQLRDPRSKELPAHLRSMMQLVPPRTIQ